MKKRWPIVLAFALFFAFVWPTPYVSVPSAFDNRIVRAAGRNDRGVLYYMGNSPVWLFVWLGIGAAVGYGVTEALERYLAGKEKGR